MNEHAAAPEALPREGTVERWLADLRQRHHPLEFRIEEPAWPAATVGELRALLEAELTGSEPGDTGPVDGAAETAVLADRARALADMATQLWRIGKRLTDPETGEVREELKREHRAYQAAWDAMTEVGIEVREYTDERMPETGSYSVNVLAFEATPGIQHETIQETVKPAIYLEGERIQMADVIVASPDQ